VEEFGFDFGVDDERRSTEDVDGVFIDQERRDFVVNSQYHISFEQVYRDKPL
jgi:hypothetical protein